MTDAEPEMNDGIKHDKGPCPRCGEPLPSYRGAASAVDDKTEICSACGDDEGFRYYHDFPLLTPEQWPIDPTTRLDLRLWPRSSAARWKSGWDWRERAREELR